MPLIMTDQDRAALQTLIERFVTTPPQSADVASDKWTKWSEVGFSKMAQGASFGEAIGTGSIYAGGEEAFKSELRRTADSAWIQCVRIHQFFDVWLETGDRMPPYFPARIPVICRKAKEFEMERAYIAALLLHSEAIYHGLSFEPVLKRAGHYGLLASDRIA